MTTEQLRKKAKLSCDEIVKFLCETPTVENKKIQAAKTSPSLPFRAHKTVLIHVPNDRGTFYAYHKPGPLTETEARVCRFIVDYALDGFEDDPISALLFLQYVHQGMEGAAVQKQELSGKTHSALNIRRDYQIIRAKAKKEHFEMHMAWTEDEHEQICLQLMKDAREGGWNYTTSGTLINQLARQPDCLVLMMHGFPF